MPVSPITEAARASAANLSAVTYLHRNGAYLNTLILSDSAALAGLSEALTAASAPSDMINAANMGMQAAGDAGELYGNMQNVNRTAQLVVPALLEAITWLEDLPAEEPEPEQ